MNSRSRISWFVVGAIISLMGSSMSAVALPLFVLQFNDPSLLGLLILTRELPAIGMFPVLGARIDRMGAYRTALWGLLMSAGAVAAIPLAKSSILALGFLMFLLGIGFVLLSPIVDMYVQVLVEAPFRARFNSVFNVLATISALLGTALAGMLADRGLITLVFQIDAATYLLGLLTILVVGHIAVPARDKERSQGLTEALRWIWNEPRLLPLLVADLGLWAALGMVRIGMPVYVLETIRERGSLLFSAALGIGTIGELVGSALAPFAVRLLSTARYVGAAAVLGVGFYLVGKLQTVYALLVITFAMSALTAVLGIWYSTRVQDLVPPTMMGRFQTLTAGASSLMEGSGNALGGFFASAGGTVAYMVAGSTSLLMAAAAWITRMARPERVTFQDTELKR